MEGKARRRFHSSGFAASRSWMAAAVTSTAISRPPVSTAMCRLVPLIFFPASYPRRVRAIISEPLTDWESMIAAVGAVFRPAASRIRSRRSSCIQ